MIMIESVTRVHIGAHRTSSPRQFSKMGPSATANITGYGKIMQNTFLLVIYWPCRARSRQHKSPIYGVECNIKLLSGETRYLNNFCCWWWQWILFTCWPWWQVAPGHCTPDHVTLATHCSTKLHLQKPANWPFPSEGLISNRSNYLINPLSMCLRAGSEPIIN